MQTCLYHSFSNNVCANCKLHHCGLTVKQMKHKNCLGKSCWHLQRNEGHPYWIQRESVKQKRKNRKNAINTYVDQLQNTGIN